MKISELIEILETTKQKNGDLDVLMNYDYQHPQVIFDVEIISEKYAKDIAVIV